MLSSNSRPSWKRRLEYSTSVVPGTPTDFRVSDLFTADLLTDRFADCIIFGYQFITNSPVTSSFPFLYLTPGWTNSNIHPTTSIRSRAPTLYGRAVSSYRYPRSMLEPWSPSFTFATITTNSSSVLVVVHAIFS
jgi:hypothetical protein